MLYKKGQTSATRKKWASAVKSRLFAGKESALCRQRVGVFACRRGQTRQRVVSLQTKKRLMKAKEGKCSIGSINIQDDPIKTYKNVQNTRKINPKQDCKKLY